MSRFNTAVLLLACVPAFQSVAQAAPSKAHFDYGSWTGTYLSEGCVSAAGADNQTLQPAPMGGWNDVEFLVALENAGLTVSTPDSNGSQYFGASFGQIDRGPVAVHKSNPGAGMMANGTSTAVTTSSGIKVTLDLAISTPVAGASGFVNTAELSMTPQGLLYRITQVTPPVANDSGYVEWRSCILKKAAK